MQVLRANTGWAPMTWDAIGLRDCCMERECRCCWRRPQPLSPYCWLSPSERPPGFFGGFSERAAKTAIDLFLSIPWLFLLLTVRAMLPLNTSPAVSVTITFLMLGILGWAAPARILLARARSMRQSDFIVMARSIGVSPCRLLGKHVLPNLHPILLAQFWISVPVFVLAEANLSLLGLGVAEPLPSLGSLLRELETVMSFRGDLCRFAALIMLILIVSGMQIAMSERKVS